MSDNSTEFMKQIGHLLQPKPASFTALDLFAGCGGLGLGFEAAGFHTVGYEMNMDSCNTYNNNLAGDCTEAFLSCDFTFPKTDIIIGGPPCQPFSVGGNQKGLKDARDGFPAFVEAVEQTKPKMWLFENVRGMLYKNKWYLSEIVEKLQNLDYVVDFELLNAAHYGVPQNRERLIVVGHNGEFKFPTADKSRVSAGDALGTMAKSTPSSSKFLTESQDRYIERYEIASKCINPRDLALDRPARTLTCRNLAGATGDMQRVLLPDGRRRRLLVREAARLQTFPDWFDFSGSETSQFNQIGNAVAPLFAYKLAEACFAYLSNEASHTATGHRASWQLGQAVLQI